LTSAARGVEIGVGEHDLRRLAAELERHRAVMALAAARDRAPVAASR
jgi:hypothetical protein